MYYEIAKNILFAITGSLIWILFVLSFCAFVNLLFGVKRKELQPNLSWEEVFLLKRLLRKDTSVNKVADYYHSLNYNKRLEELSIGINNLTDELKNHLNNSLLDLNRVMDQEFIPDLTIGCKIDNLFAEYYPEHTNEKLMSEKLKCLEKPVSVIDLSFWEQNIIQNRLKCQTIEDVFYLMIENNRNTLVFEKLLGEKLVKGIESYMLSEGLIRLENGVYFANL